jgi:hypothetical protein
LTFRFLFAYTRVREGERVQQPPSIELDRDPVHALMSIAALVTPGRRSLAAAVHSLRALASSGAAPGYVRRILRKNTLSLRHALSVRHRALWLSREGRVPEAILSLDVAKSVLCCEASPCEVQRVDAWLPIHTRALELMDDTRSQIFHQWRRAS